MDAKVPLSVMKSVYDSLCESAPPDMKAEDAIATLICVAFQIFNEGCDGGTQTQRAMEFVGMVVEVASNASEVENRRSMS